MHIVFRPQSYLLIVCNCKPLIPGASVSFICECILAVYHHGNALRLYESSYCGREFSLLIYTFVRIYIVSVCIQGFSDITNTYSRYRFCKG